jgi:hypothetical protein
MLIRINLKISNVCLQATAKTFIGTLLIVQQVNCFDLDLVTFYIHRNTVLSPNEQTSEIVEACH